MSLGKSLDKIAELREKNKLSKPGKKKRRKAQAKVKNIKLSAEVSSGDIFDFINTKLGGKRGLRFANCMITKSLLLLLLIIIINEHFQSCVGSN